jgi:hypothetical protein
MFAGCQRHFHHRSYQIYGSSGDNRVAEASIEEVG